MDKRTNDIARTMCASRDGGARFFTNCAECPCDGGCLYQELAASLKGYRKQTTVAWIVESNGVHICPACEKRFSFRTNFCSNCGAMTGG